MKIYIFVSFGRDDFFPQIKVLVEALKKRKNEYVIWLDEKMQPAADYHRQIENELYMLKKNKPNSCFIYVITPYSVDTERYNYCINEIERALKDRIRILPIKLVKAQSPIQIGCLQWYDMTQCEIDIDNKDFQNRLSKMCEIIDSTEPIKFDGKQGSLYNLLNPCQFTLDMDKHLHNYCPRQWLLDATLNWLDNRNERVLLVKGGLGTGKTAFSLWLATRKLPERIHAWHLCQYNDVNTRSLLTCVKSLTWYLASRLPHFYDSFDDWGMLEQITSGGDENAAAVFKKLILENLINTHICGESIVILIDALDEASQGGVNGLANILAQYAEVMPHWLRFIITTRNDASVTIPLKEISFMIDLDERTNRENCLSDIRAFVETNLDKSFIEKHENAVEVITRRSGNVILYAKLMCDAINNGMDINMLQLPKGLRSYYDAHMRRYFGTKSNLDFDTYALPILQLTLASYQPIKREFIYKRIHDTEVWCKTEKRTKFKQVLNCFGPLLKEDEDYILLFHKSLSEWFTDKGNASFYVSREDGIEKMCDWGTVVLSDNLAEEELALHFYTYQPQYLIEANKNKDLIKLFTDLEFWKKRKDVLGVDLMLQRMFTELPMINKKVKNIIFKTPEFCDLLYYFGANLFDKGLFVQLKLNGFTAPLREGMNYGERITALRYYYINGEYTTINKNIGLFNRSCEESEMEPRIQNMLGLATKKCGNISQSAVFYRRAIQLSSIKKHLIHYHLNLSRVLMILCRFDEARSELEKALDDFYHSDCIDGIEDSDIEFAFRQLELAVRYVVLETELYSTTYNTVLCERELEWADQLYSSKLRIDRYYPRHLQSKALFLLREHRFDELDSVLNELKDAQSVGFDDVRTCFYQSVFLYAVGCESEGFQIAQELLSELCKKDTFLIERTECMALIDALEKQNHLTEISDELRPWYFHMASLIKQIVG